MNKKVLIVEDDAEVRDALELIFCRAGYATKSYINGNKLLEGAYEETDVIVLDRQLSGVDGLDICRHIKAQSVSKHIPVLMLSASPNVGHLAEAAGAEAFLEKPFRTSELLDVVSQLITL